MKRLSFTSSHILGLCLGIIFSITLIVFIAKDSYALKTISIFPALVAAIAGISAAAVAIIQNKKKPEEMEEETAVDFKKSLEEVEFSIVNIDPEIYNQLTPENELETAMSIISNQSRNISSYVKSLSYSLYMNLTIGMLFASLSISFLYLLYIAPANIDIINREDESARYLQLAFPISLQILSLFFLGLYKKTSLDIKYMNNEITNIELKKAALAMSNSFNEENKLHLAKTLINTERNFTIKKGESTHHIQETQNNSPEMMELLKTIQAIAKK